MRISEVRAPFSDVARGLNLVCVIVYAHFKLDSVLGPHVRRESQSLYLRGGKGLARNVARGTNSQLYVVHASVQFGSCDENKRGGEGVVHVAFVRASARAAWEVGGAGGCGPLGHHPPPRHRTSIEPLPPNPMPSAGVSLLSSSLPFFYLTIYQLPHLNT